MTIYRKRLLTVFLFGAAFSWPAFSAPPAVLHGRVIDEETGEMIPCTVTIRASDGSVPAESRAFDQGFRSSGVFEKAVPPGEAAVTVRRGFDYGALTKKVELRPGERRELEFTLMARPW